MYEHWTKGYEALKNKKTCDPTHRTATLIVPKDEASLKMPEKRYYRAVCKSRVMAECLYCKGLGKC